MRANAFVAILICIAVFLAGCSADINSTESDTNFKGAETTVQTNQNDTEQYTQDTEISDVINDTAFGDYGRLIFPVNSSHIVPVLRKYTETKQARNSLILTLFSLMIR